MVVSLDTVVGLIGWPTSHSISPIMHNQAFHAVGLKNWCYVPMPVSPTPTTRIKEAVLGLRALGCRGANVTVPYKEKVIPYLDNLSDEAQAIGAVNTIVVEKNGKLCGHNTDARGFLADLDEHQVSLKNSRALVLGAGGSSRAIVYALLMSGCSEVAILNRTEAKALELADRYKKYFPHKAILGQQLSEENIRHAQDFHLVVNTTSVGLGHQSDEMPWFSSVAFAPNQVVYDLIYNPPTTTLLKHAHKHGATTISGLGMLVHQGALAFSLWTGLKAPIQAMKQAAYQALK